MGKKIRVHILMNSTADCRKMMQFYLKFQISCCEIVWKWKGPPNVTLLPILKKSIHLGPKSATTFYFDQYLVTSQNALKTDRCKENYHRNKELRETKGSFPIKLNESLVSQYRGPCQLQFYEYEAWLVIIDYTFHWLIIIMIVMIMIMMNL